jgi:endonuclease/exonuclease/phosphatase family metal-dependent hydrolase
MYDRRVRLGPVSLCSLVLVAGCEPPTLSECIDRVDPELLELGLIAEPPKNLSLEVAPNLRLMTINVGNGSEDGRYALRLPWQSYEDHIGSQIRARRPDLVAVQEVLPRANCDASSEDDPARTCFDHENRPDQIRRLLGEDYSILCDRDRQVDCIGVHVDFASVEGLTPGGYEPRWPDTMDLPADLDACDFLDGSCKEKFDRCDSESSIFSATIETVGGHRIRVVALHPAALGQSCRERQLSDAFTRAKTALAEDPPAKILMIGDWNTDPDRLNRPVEEILYYSHVGPGRLLREHDERNEDCARVPTSPNDFAAIDRVVTDFARGFCSTWHNEHVPIGGSEPRGRFDASFSDWSSLPKGRDDPTRLDHSAVDCDLYWDAL